MSTRERHLRKQLLRYQQLRARALQAKRRAEAARYAEESAKIQRELAQLRRRRPAKASKVRRRRARPGRVALLKRRRAAPIRRKLLLKRKAARIARLRAQRAQRANDPSQEAAYTQQAEEFDTEAAELESAEGGDDGVEETEDATPVQGGRRVPLRLFQGRRRGMHPSWMQRGVQPVVPEALPIRSGASAEDAEEDAEEDAKDLEAEGVGADELEETPFYKRPVVWAIGVAALGVIAFIFTRGKKGGMMSIVPKKFRIKKSSSEAAA